MRKNLPTNRLGFALAALLLSAPLGVSGQVSTLVVNGLGEVAEPTTAALLEGLDPDTAIAVCSAVLVGCDTLISAGHCFKLKTNRKWIFLQHAGFYEIESATVQPDYAAYSGTPYAAIPREDDISVIKLVEPVTGIMPSPINTTSTPAPGTDGEVIGFGREPLTEESVFQINTGIKRSGNMTTAACQDATLSPYDVICWEPPVPIPPPGEGVSTCNVDSGGPMFVDGAGTRVVAGLTKGAVLSGGSCTPPVEAFDTNVFRHHSWITSTVAANGAVALNVGSCGSLAQVDQEDAAVVCDGTPWGSSDPPRMCGFEGELDSVTTTAQHTFDVPAGSSLLRVNLNGTSRTTNPVDMNFYVRAGAPATTSVYDCAATASGSFGACEFAAPQTGTWYVLVERGASSTGVGQYQVVATEFPTASVPALSLAAQLALVGILLAAASALTMRSRPTPDFEGSVPTTAAL